MQIADDFLQHAELWNQFRQHMMESFCHKIHPNNEHLPHLNCETFALLEVQSVLQEHSLKCSSFGLKDPPADLAMQENQYDLEEKLALAEGDKETLNAQQRSAYDFILTALDAPINSGKLFFLDGPGGSGKTYLYTTLLRYCRRKQISVLSAATTGVAANLLLDGKTIHSLFGLPIPLNETSVSNIKLNTDKAKLLREAKLIIIDECTMTSNHVLDTTDRLLKEIMKNYYPFGGKVLLFGGDFRQCLSVLPHALQAAIIQNSMQFAKSRDLFKKLPLTMNMRSNDPEYSEWLLKFGNGTLSDNNGLSEDVVEIPLSMICKDSLVNWGNKIQPGNTSEISERAILCPKNSDVDKLNDDVLNIIEGNDTTYLSVVSVVADNKASANNFPTEFLNSLSPSGMPPHKLRLEIGSIIMLLRNLNTRRGLCNGTRLEVLQLRNNVIIAKSLTGSSKGEIRVIPRIDLAPSQTGLPFQLRRRQFP
ncbi:ATP-dependent DNA helicase pif1-like, partial [Stegodyphus dumicola]|uniref:ATP-dependent DNA helicase pif1-like n=1 Tax=Stegodyphus dumicola TaxID=202533 RepID=UPI0015B12CEA